MKSEIYKDKICMVREGVNPQMTLDPPHEHSEQINVLEEEEAEDLQEGDIQRDHHEVHQENHWTNCLEGTTTTTIIKIGMTSMETMKAVT